MWPQTRNRTLHDDESAAHTPDEQPDERLDERFGERPGERPGEWLMIAAGLVELTQSGPRIVVGRRPDGSLVFPLPRADQAECERVLLEPNGTLWSWTVQRFCPKSPPYVAAEGAFVPFFVGYVEFPEGIIIEGRIQARVGRDDLRIGMAMEVTVITVCADASGAPVHLFAFRPAEAGA